MSGAGGAGHYFDDQPAAASAPSLVEVRLPGETLALETDAGVFSGSRLDPGTRVLLELASPPPATGELADLGCGWGAIAVWLARQSPQARVWAVDVNRRAVELTRRNALRAGTANVVATAPDGVPEDLVLDALYANPPVRIGKPALQSLLAAWLGRLRPGACAWLVVNRHLGADSLARWLAGEGHAVTRRGSRRGYRVLSVGAR